MQNYTYVNWQTKEHDGLCQTQWAMQTQTQDVQLSLPRNTGGVCWPALSSSPITATFPVPFRFFEQGVSNQEVYLFKQSVKECSL